MVTAAFSVTESPAIWNEEQQRAHALQRAPLRPKARYVRVRLDEPSMEAAIRSAAVYCTSIMPPFTARRETCEAFLVRLLRLRMRLVRTEFLRRKLKDMMDKERLQYRVKEMHDAYLRLRLSPEEMTIVKDSLEVLGPRLERNLADAERRLLLRCTVLHQAMEAGKRPHSELVRVLNGQRNNAVALALEPRNDGQKAGNAGSAELRLRFREWTVRAALFAIMSYMRYSTSPLSWRRAYRLLERMIRMHRDVIASQVRYGKPGYWLSQGGVVRRGLGVEPNKQAYVTPRFRIQELRIVREGLELRGGELGRASEESGKAWRRQLNPTERVLLLRATLLYGARYDVGKRGIAWRLGGLSKKKREGPRARLW